MDSTYKPRKPIEHNRYKFVKPDISTKHILIDNRDTVYLSSLGLGVEHVLAEEHKDFPFDTVYTELDIDYNRLHVILERHNYREDSGRTTGTPGSGSAAPR